MELQSTLILSGGLGSSPYVRSAIKERYGDGARGRFPNAEDMSILLAEEPYVHQRPNLKGFLHRAIADISLFYLGNWP